MVLHPFRGATDDGQLAVLESVRASGIQAPNVSYADCRDFQENLRSISGLLLNQHVPASVGDGESAYSAWFELVSGNYFDVLGVKPFLGRTFNRDKYDYRAGSFPTVISYRLWQEYFGGDPSTGAAYSDSIPLGFGLGKWTDVVVEGYASRPGENLAVHHASVKRGCGST
jgi:hypothetical protein